MSLKELSNIRKVFFYLDNHSSVEDAGLILGGKVFGIMGTDDLRRDLAVGIIWGTPIALFIGLTVSIFSIAIGPCLCVVAGYRGKRTDETMMRVMIYFMRCQLCRSLFFYQLLLGVASF
jgi:peptide/nickel transport system permease protein